MTNLVFVGIRRADDGRPVCTRCPLHLTCSGVVPGQGSVNPRLVIVGEAPGKHEDIEGSPFVGRSGEVLSDALAQAGLSRTNVYITNTVKCRPKNDRTPTTDELKTCREVFLNSELERFRHVPWVLLGATAIRAIGDVPGGVRENQGRHWTNKSGVSCWGTWHPAAVLRGMGRTDLIAEVLARASAQVVVTDVRPTARKVLAVDTETDGLDPFRGRRPFIATSAMGDRGRLYYLEREGDRDALRADIADADEVVMHNATFDVHMLDSVGVKVPVEKVRDTRWNAALVDSGNHPYSLEMLSDRYFGRGAVWKHKMREHLRGKKFADGYKDVPADILEPYALEDAALTWSLYHHPLFVKAREMWPSAWKRETELLPVLLDIERRGIPIDLANVPAAQAAMDASLEQMLARVRSDPLTGLEFNPSSSIQVAEFAERANVFTDEYTANGNPSYGHRVLERSGNETAEVIAEYRRLRAIRNGPMKNLPAVLAPDGRIHPSYDSMGSESNRFTGKTRVGRGEEGRVNLLGVPDIPDVRSVFAAPEGFWWLSADLKQIENRGIAHYSSDESLIAAYNANPDEDYYRLAGRLVYGREITDEERKLFKAVVLARGYGARLRKIAKMTGLPLDVAEAFLQKLDARMPGVADFFKRVDVWIREHGRIVAEDWPSDLDPRASYQGVNRIVQGACAVALKRMLIELSRVIDSDCQVIHHVHDEVDFVVRKGQMAKWVPIIRETMLGVFDWSVPVRVSMSWGPNWGDLTDWTGIELQYPSLPTVRVNAKPRRFRSLGIAIESTPGTRMTLESKTTVFTSTTVPEATSPSPLVVGFPRRRITLAPRNK